MFSNESQAGPWQALVKSWRSPGRVPIKSRVGESRASPGKSQSSPERIPDGSRPSPEQVLGKFQSSPGGILGWSWQGPSIWKWNTQSQKIIYDLKIKEEFLVKEKIFFIDHYFMLH